MYEQAAFGPFELDLMSAAFEMALTNAAEETMYSAKLHPHMVRCQIAAGIFAAAQVGVTDLDDLATEGLRALQVGQES
jgi:hypothetical protein